MIIGVTGLIGSGKSEVAAMFEELGAKIIDCDQIGREVVENDPNILSQLAEKFGESILNADKTLDRGKLGKLAFSNPEKTAILNSIVHPPLLAELDRRMEHARGNNYPAVVDAALLVFWNYHKKMDYTVLVSSFTRNRIKRLLAGGLTNEEIRQRSESQLSLSYLQEWSDFVITNNNDLDDLRKKAKILYLELTKREIG
jgi:dephospho-CoA kinase